jgi:hypothetical protein
VSTATQENKLSDETEQTVKQFQQLPLLTSNTIDDETIIEYETIVKYCTTIPTDTALGPDNISPFHLKYGGDGLYQCLFILFNLCFMSGILPLGWTSANICALHKSGIKTAPSNFRPISLTSIVIRLYERIILPKVMQVINRSNKLNKFQFGFRKQRSTIDNLYVVVSHIYKAMSCHTKRKKDFKSAKLPITYLDLKKAFDSINIDATLYKLAQFGITGRLYLFFKSFLTNRQIRTMFGNEFSNWYKIDMGTPQGSVLGPIIFLIYINDLLDEIEQTGTIIPL